MLSAYEVLALPARRDILDQLRTGPRTVGDLTDVLGSRQPIVSKQLRILRESGFVAVRIDGQRRWYELRPEPFRELEHFLAPYQRFWEERLDLLADHLDVMKEQS